MYSMHTAIPVCPQPGPTCIVSWCLHRAGRCWGCLSPPRRPADPSGTPVGGRWSWSPWVGVVAAWPPSPPPAWAAAAWWQPDCRSRGEGRWGSRSGRHGWSPETQRMDMLQWTQSIHLVTINSWVKTSSVSPAPAFHAVNAFSIIYLTQSMAALF